MDGAEARIGAHHRGAVVRTRWLPQPRSNARAWRAPFWRRHAYFTGADEPYDKLKRALRAEINEEVWSALYATESLAFDRPSTGRIAVKVINHYGDEVLKVYEV